MRLPAQDLENLGMNLRQHSRRFVPWSDENHSSNSEMWKVVTTPHRANFARSRPTQKIEELYRFIRKQYRICGCLPLDIDRRAVKKECTLINKTSLELCRLAMSDQNAQCALLFDRVETRGRFCRAGSKAFPPRFESLVMGLTDHCDSFWLSSPTSLERLQGSREGVLSKILSCDRSGRPMRAGASGQAR